MASIGAGGALEARRRASEEAGDRGWVGGRLTWTPQLASYGSSSFYAPQATVTYNLRVWDSVHFGYYFYASRGDILVVKFSGS